MIGGIVGGVLDFAAAQELAKAQREAAEINAEAQREINAQNLQYSRESRGLGGLPVSLPLYSGTTESGTLFPRATSTWDSLMKQWGTPTDQLNRNAATVGRMAPSQAGAEGLVGDLFSGQRTQQRLAEQMPVSSARNTAAAATRQGLMTSLQQQLNKLEAQQANKGYVGGSTFDRAALMREATPVYQQAAEAEAFARLQNQMDIQGIRNQDWQTAFSNLSLPQQMAGQAMAMQSMPALQAVQDYNTAYQVFSPFRLSEWNPPAMQPMPQYPVIQTTLGNLASVGSDVLGSYQQNKAQQQAADQYWTNMRDIFGGSQATAAPAPAQPSGGYSMYGPYDTGYQYPSNLGW